jgi:hypothetical protein
MACIRSLLLDVLGTAYPDEKGAGYFAYVFYDRIQELAQRRRLGHALLADVLAHEIGHCCLDRLLIPRVESCARIGIMKNYGKSLKELCRSFHPIKDHAGPDARSPGPTIRTGPDAR